MQTWLDAWVNATYADLAPRLGDLVRIPLAQNEAWKAAAEGLVKSHRSGQAPVLRTVQAAVVPGTQGFLWARNRIEVRCPTFFDHIRPFLFGTTAASVEHVDGSTVVTFATSAFWPSTVVRGAVEPAGAWDPVAVRVDRALVDDLFGAKAPDTPEVEAWVRSHTWLIDLPHRAVMLNTEKQLRAILVRPHHSGGVAGIGIVTAPDSNTIISVAACPLYGEGQVETGDVSEARNYDGPAAMDHVRQLARLVVAYHMVAQPDCRVPVPHIDPKVLETDRNAKSKGKRFTLFRVTDLRAPADRFGRTDRHTPGASWTLGHAVKVRGHYRLQPHGPRNSLRKLIWVAEFLKGPRDEPERLPLTVLRKAAGGAQ